MALLFFRDLDDVSAVEPAATLGGELPSEGMTKEEEKKLKNQQQQQQLQKKKVCPGNNTMQVLELCSRRSCCARAIVSVTA